MAMINILPLFLWMSVLAAQLTGNYAPCAVSCVLTDPSPSCGNLDIVCFCSNLPYLQSLALCVKNTCSPQDYQNSTVQLIDTCASAGVTVNLTAILASSTSTSTLTSTSISTRVNTTSFTLTSTLVSTSSSSVLQSGTSNPSAAATFTGGTLLTGICMTPQFTSTLTAGTVTEFPQVGCASDNLGCCPLNFSALTSCPADYTTTSLACCPSGWSIYSTSLGGNTPCYSTLLIPASEPIATLTSSNVHNSPTSTVTIVDQVFTYKFDLQPSTPSGIGEAAKIGIGVGIGLGALLVLGFFLLKRYRRSRNPQTPPKHLIPPPYSPRQAELDSIALQELETSRGPGPRIELQNTVWELGP